MLTNFIIFYITWNPLLPFSHLQLIISLFTSLPFYFSYVFYDGSMLHDLINLINLSETQFQLQVYETLNFVKELRLIRKVQVLICHLKSVKLASFCFSFVFYHVLVLAVVVNLIFLFVRRFQPQIYGISNHLKDSRLFMKQLAKNYQFLCLSQVLFSFIFSLVLVLFDVINLVNFLEQLFQVQVYETLNYFIELRYFVKLRAQ